MQHEDYKDDSIGFLIKRRAMKEQEITIQVGGRQDIITPESVAEVMSSLVETLKSVDSNMRKVGTALYKWRITSASKKSPFTFTMRGELPAHISDEHAEDVVGTVVRGWNKLNEGAKKAPKYFTPDDLKRASILAGVFGDSVSTLSIDTPSGDSIKFSTAVGESAKAIATPKLKQPSDEYGSIEGILRQITVDNREGYLKSEFQIIDRITGTVVICKFNSEVAETIGAKIKHRIAVSGEIKFDKAGKPQTIAVGNHRFLKDEDQLPSLEDIHKLKLRLPNDEDPADFIDDLRGVEDG